MMNLADLAVIEALKSGLAFLASNPNHIEFMLAGFEEISPIRKLVGPEYIKQCVDYMSNNRVYVTPYYEYDIKRTPSIAVVSSGAEGQQFIGDYGSNVFGPIFCKPRVYTRWDATSIDLTTNTMSVSPSYLLETKLWRNVVITDGTQELRLDGVLTREGQDTQLFFKPTTPITTINLKGWQSQSDQPQKGYEISSSIDDVSIQCKLSTVGDASLHRLLQMAVRYILKMRRPLLDSYGLQCATFNYSPVMQTDQEEQLYESAVTITAKAPEAWISAEYDLNDTAARIDIQVQIESQFPSSSKATFTIDEFPTGTPTLE